MLVLAMEFSRDARARRCRRSLSTEQEQPDDPPIAGTGDVPGASPEDMQTPPDPTVRRIASDRLGGIVRHLRLQDPERRCSLERR